MAIFQYLLIFFKKGKIYGLCGLWENLCIVNFFEMPADSL